MHEDFWNKERDQELLFVLFESCNMKLFCEWDPPHNKYAFFSKIKIDLIFLLYKKPFFIIIKIDLIFYKTQNHFFYLLKNRFGFYVI